MLGWHIRVTTLHWHWASGRNISSLQSRYDRGAGMTGSAPHRQAQIATNVLGMEASMSRKMMMAILPLVGLGLVLSAGTAEAGYSGPPSAYSDAYAYPYDDPLYGAFDFEY